MCLKPVEDFIRLENVASKQKEWAATTVEEKLAILNELIETIKEIGYEDIAKGSGEAALPMMGIPNETDEGIYEREQLCLLLLALYKTNLCQLQNTFELRASNKLPELKMRKAINGQICVETFPILKESKNGALAGSTGEVWLDERISSTNDVDCFQYEEMESPGMVVVLGAGNQGGLALVDVLYSMFIKNSVVYLKLHEIRQYLEPLYQRLLHPLIKRGFFDMERHTTNERASALVNHPLVTNVHLTGGKATHDLIVWGNHNVQETNKQKGTSVLNATMTSELGAVSPWVIVPAKYTRAELEDQARLLAFFIHSNASCNCNSPKAVVMSSTWDQAEEFIAILENDLAFNPLPVAYYPGAQQRWDAYRAQYPDARCIESTSGQGISERGLSAPMKSSTAVLLPYLALDFSVDLSSEAGRVSAAKEYAFRTEPFCPVYSVVRLQNTETLDAFCEVAPTFCNDYLFGSLSMSMTAKPELQTTDAYQRLVGSLKYGGIAVNNWGGTCYGCGEGAWGAFPGETLDNVESGIGRIHNMLGVSGFEKFVLTGPIVSLTHPKLDDLKKTARIYAAFNKLFVEFRILTLVELIGALAGVDWKSVAMASGGIAAAAIASGYYYFVR